MHFSGEPIDDVDDDSRPFEESDLLTILKSLQAEMELYARSGMRVSPGRLVLWLHEVRLAIEAAKKDQS